MQCGVREIGIRAFMGCHALEEIRLPDSLREIGQRAFYGCKALREITAGQSAVKLGSMVLGWCDSLRTLRFGDRGAVKLPEALIPGLRADVTEGAVGTLLTGTPYLENPLGISLYYLLERCTFVYDAKAAAFLSDELPQNLPELTEWILLAESTRALEFLLTHPEWISQKALSECVQKAIRHTAEGGSIEPQVMLMDYYNTHYGAEDAENITL